MSDALVEIKCPRCGHTWHVDMATLGAPDQVIYRDPQHRVETYRLRCRKCGTYAMVDVEVEEEADDG